MEEVAPELDAGASDTPATESGAGVEQSEAATTDTPTAKDSAVEEELPHDKVQGSKHYKSLQAEFTRKSTALAELDKKFQQYGGPDALLREAERFSKLSQSKEFQAFMAEQQMRESGIDPSTLPPDARAAMEFINSVVQKQVESKVNPFLQQAQEMERAQQTAKVNANLAAMSEKYGAEWRELQPVMQEIASNLPPQVINDMRFETLESVYLQAMVKSGKFNEFAAKQYQKQLSEKKQKSTPRPGNGANGTKAIPQVRSMQDAYKAAKVMLGD